MSGKGSDPRPLSVTTEQFNERFDAIDWNAREREAQQKPEIIDIRAAHLQQLRDGQKDAP